LYTYDFQLNTIFKKRSVERIRWLFSVC